MLQNQLSRNEKLLQLVADGYDVQVTSKGKVIINNIPYYNQKGEKKFGSLHDRNVSINNDTVVVGDHTMYFIGEVPFDKNGAPIKMYNCQQPISKLFGSGYTPAHMFSSKPDESIYRDFHKKVHHYVELISQDQWKQKQKGTLQIIDTPSIHRFSNERITSEGIAHIHSKLELNKVVIIGLGGTGSYILDSISKFPIKNILLIDGDVMEEHNTFRAPGIANVEEIGSNKAQVYCDRYSEMRNGITALPEFLKPNKYHLLDDADYIFLAIDGGQDKMDIIKYLEASNKKFIACGIGVSKSHDDQSLFANLDAFMIAPGESYELIKDISCSNDADNVYSTNIQTCELNSMNAAQAIILFKKHIGYYYNSDKTYRSSLCVPAIDSDSI